MYYEKVGKQVRGDEILFEKLDCRSEQVRTETNIIKKGCERDIRLIDDRLRVLEKKMWSIAGALAVVSVMISPIGQRILSQVLTPPAQTSMMVPGNTLVNGSN